MLLSYKRASNMKLEYQISQLGRGDSWHCNKNSTTHEMVAYNTKTSGYNDMPIFVLNVKKILIMAPCHTVMIVVELWETG